MINKIEETVTVAAVFGGKPVIRPVWFIWRGRKYRVINITYSWMEREGSENRYHFAVSDGSDLYELCYNREHLCWQLIAVETEG